MCVYTFLCLCRLFNSVKTVAQTVEIYPAGVTDLTLEDEVREVLRQKLKRGTMSYSLFFYKEVNAE